MNRLPSNSDGESQRCVFYKAQVIQAHNSHMAHVWKFKCRRLLPGFLQGLSEVSTLNCTSLSASHDAPPHLQPGAASERGYCSCHSEACCMHLWHRVGEIIPIIPLECLWINQFCMNKWPSLADFDLQSRLVINGLVYLFKRRDKKVLYSTKSHWKKTELQVFLAKATPC